MAAQPFSTFVQLGGGELRCGESGGDGMPDWSGLPRRSVGQIGTLLLLDVASIDLVSWLTRMSPPPQRVALAGGSLATTHW